MPGELLSPEDKVFICSHFYLISESQVGGNFQIILLQLSSKAIGINIAQCVRMLGTAGVLKVTKI